MKDVAVTSKFSVERSNRNAEFLEYESDFILHFIKNVANLWWTSILKLAATNNLPYINLPNPERKKTVEINNQFFLFRASPGPHNKRYVEARLRGDTAADQRPRQHGLYGHLEQIL